MKRILTLLTIFAMVGIVSCKKPEQAATATINASDVTVEEGQTATIGATTNSTAAITYSSNDASIAVVSGAGQVTGIKAGSTNITLKVAAVEGKFTAAEKTIKVTVTPKEVVPPTPEVNTINIDGDFSDWSKLEAGTFTKSVTDPDAPWEAVYEIRCYAEPDYVFYYIKFDQEILDELLSYSGETLPVRVNLNTDGEFTSGYTSYFLEGYDFMIEGHLYGGGEWASFDGALNQRVNGKWSQLRPENEGMCCGAGNGCEYELRLDRAMFNEAANTSEVPMPMGDDFQTSMRFYTTSVNPNWDELSNIPNSSLEEEQGNGYGYLMRIHTNK